VFDDIGNIDHVIMILKLVGVSLALLLIVGRIVYYFGMLKGSLRARKLEKELSESPFEGPFSDKVLKSAVRNYIQPDCSSTDPSHESDLRYTVDVREQLFSVVDRYVQNDGRRKHLMILADSGMGKTSFCLNYFHYFRKTGKHHVALINLSNGDDISRLGLIKNQSKTVLILDGLDEDAKILEDFNERMTEILITSKNFMMVIITCRSQFFQHKDQIPVDTGVSLFTPRKAGEDRNFKIYHMYLMPFNKRQVDQYISHHFPRYNFLNYPNRKKSFKMIDKVPELTVRPMLLELLPDLVKEKSVMKELFELYRYMIDKWLEREKSWIPKEVLFGVSVQLSVYIYGKQLAGEGDRVTLDELHAIAAEHNIDSDYWRQLSGRSLLNRDGDGKFKFSHRSIMEFFFVQGAIQGNPKCFQISWTDLMRELFVSWGHSERDLESVEQARTILRSNLSKTGLIPLSEPPIGPGFVTNKDLDALSSSIGPAIGLRRPISPSWRLDSLLIATEFDQTKVFDIEYDLEWSVPRIDVGEVDGVEINNIRQVSDLQRLENGDHEFRYPSYAEFISLIRALSAAGKIDILSKRVLYYLGDKWGDREHMLVALQPGNVAPEMMRQIDVDRPVEGTDQKISTYLASVYVNPAAFNSVKAVGIRVKVEAQLSLAV
jgi:hypothetical protein